ncbi:putative thioesterase atnL [Paramyrothecium foliicola]|nr:putative thioesterase atnL [Paramyrothecium foliicola]
MASAAGKMSVLSVLAPVAVGSAGYAAWRLDWQTALRAFLTGPGRTSRIILLLFVVFNWKNLPFAWTYRVLYTILYHTTLRKSPQLTPKALFKPMISQTKAPLLEIDYNLHKSNSTYFADLDVSRSHLVTYLIRPSLRKVAENHKTRLVLDPAGKPLKGSLTVALGAVECSFKREIAGFRPYEMWSRVLSWDRKWLFIVTHFVPRGAARPTSWMDPRCARERTRGPGDAAGGWDKKIYASAVSKYVFKVGRFTVHPAIVLGASGLLPERPGGWTSGDNQLGEEGADVADVNLAVDGEWDWRRVEAQRRKGMEIASHFHALDALVDEFDGGNYGALGRFGPG